MRSTAVMSLPMAKGSSQLLEVGFGFPNEIHAYDVPADGHVRVWSTNAVYNAADINSTEPKQLAHMSYHSGTIHTVRFSPSGRFLASGADDKIVCVYTLDPNPPSHSATFGM